MPCNRLEVTVEKGTTRTNNEVPFSNGLSKTSVKIWRSVCRLPLRTMSEMTRTRISVMEKK